MNVSENEKEGLMYSAISPFVERTPLGSLPNRNQSDITLEYGSLLQVLKLFFAAV
jgi:hypothetical protein